LTRALFLELTGTQAAPWNPEKPIKRWFDPAAAQAVATDPGGFYMYQINVWRDGKLVRATRMIPNAEAALANLPGKYDYPKYSVPPSKAFIREYDESGMETGGRTYIKADDLSLFTEARALQTELTAAGFPSGGIFESMQGGPFAIVYPPEEPRRLWYLSHPAKPGGWSVARLLAQKFAQGVGAPGKWVPSEEDVHTPRWQSLLSPDVGEYDTRPEIPCPQRALLPNEEAVFDGFTGQVMIRRMDNPIAQAASDAAAMPGRVREVLAIAREILAELKEGA
jgi:hypothetical protein